MDRQDGNKEQQQIVPEVDLMKIEDDGPPASCGSSGSSISDYGIVEGSPIRVKGRLTSQSEPSLVSRQQQTSGPDESMAKDMPEPLSKHLSERMDEQEDPSNTNTPDSAANGFWEYFKTEIMSNDFDDSHEFKSERIKNFLSVPNELEKLLFLGYLICLDSFLYNLTILPIRIVIGIFRLFSWVFLGGVALKPAQKTDLVKGALIATCTFVLLYFDASRLYHSVRGQAIIKLYVIFNVLEICDKLCSAFGHDILDSLFSLSSSSDSWPASRRRISRLTHFIVAQLYVIAHSLVLFYQVMTLNVAVNSYNNALMTLLLSNQFVELKSSVFKRFEKKNLFQLSCSDIVERFQLSVFLAIIMTRNFLEMMCEHNSFALFGFGLDKQTFLHAFGQLLHPVDLVRAIFKSEAFKVAEILLTPLITIYITEILVDWLKHAFITKFNGLLPILYNEYQLSLCRDLLGVNKLTRAESQSSDMFSLDTNESPQLDPSKMASIDRSPIVARRIGFVSIPLTSLIIRVSVQTIQMIVDIYEEGTMDSSSIHRTLDESGDDLGGWKIPLTIPSWMKIGITSFVFKQSFNVLVFCAFVGLLIYFGLVTSKLLLGVKLQQLAKQKLKNAAESPKRAPKTTPNTHITSVSGLRVSTRTGTSPYVNRIISSHLDSSVSMASDLQFSRSDLDNMQPASFTDEKLDEIDRFTMIKSRIV